MSFRLSVAHDLGTLAHVLAGELAQPLADPFAAELVVVPGDGLRAWLTGQLARSLGATSPTASDGIAANIDFIFPGALMRRALGESDVGAWSVGPLTWSVYEALVHHGESLGRPADLLRARTIADLFDRYTLHRSAMVRRWEAGSDVDAVGQPLPGHMLWQPQLWRLVLTARGGRSDAQVVADAARELREQVRTPTMPDRVFLFGLASLPSPHLEVLAALAHHCDVHVLAPAPSLVAWRRIIVAASEPLALPLARTADPTAAAVQHPLAFTWSRAAREAHLLLASVAIESGCRPTELADLPTPDPLTSGSPTLLARLQAGIRADEVSTHSVAVPIQGDRSVWWHRCHGSVRQAEVLRDELLRVLQTERPGGGRYQPRDIAILCPDPVTMGPIVEAVFAGDGGLVPAVPVQVADRSLLQHNQLLDALGAMLDLLEGRFRASEVLAFAALPAVRRRFHLDADQLGQVVDWVLATNARWGLDGESHEQFGLPPNLNTYTWQAALDQLLVGAAMADSGPRLGPGGTVPFAGIEGDSVETLGAIADLLSQLGAIRHSLCGPMSAAEFVTAISAAIDALLSVPDTDSWQRRDVDRLLDEFAADSARGLGDATLHVATSELAALLEQRLKAGAARVRFESGSVTLSSFTAQRGVPHPVVCLIGLDGDVGGSGTVAADDLTAQPACVGDRDARSELRAQLLDAVLAAGERLVICSTAHDLRTNGPVPPVVPLAELCDLIDATLTVPHDPTGGRPRRSSDLIATDHPRQAWSDANFIDGALHVDGPWSFDRAARDAADARMRRSANSVPFATRLAPETLERITVADLIGTLRNPVETLVRHRLEARLERDAGLGVDDLVPLISSGLEAWQVANSLLAHRIELGDEWSDQASQQWAEVQQRTGIVPPGLLGDIALDAAAERVHGLLDVLSPHIDGGPLGTLQSIEVEVAMGQHTVMGEVPGVRGSLIVDVTPSSLKPHNRLTAWVRLAVLTLQRPDVQWEAVVVGTQNGKPAAIRLRLTDVAAAAASLETIIDLHLQARTELVPALAGTSECVANDDLSGAVGAWNPRGPIPGENSDRWVQFALGSIDLDDLLDPTSPSHRPSLRSWSKQLWGAYDAAVCVISADSSQEAAGDDD